MSLLDDVSIVVTPNGYKAGELYAVIPVPTEGAEEITNGDFATDSDWSKSTGVTISGGNAIFNNSTAGNNGIYQATVFQTNTQYKITAEVSNYSSGNVTAWSGSSQNSTSNESFTGNGTKTWIISTGASNGYFLLSSATTNGNFNIDNVSVKEYTSADMDVTRATAATRVDENGLVNYAEDIGGEEITNGDFATNLDFWSTSSWWVWNSLGAYHPSTSSHKPLYQQCCVIGKTYLITFDLNCVGSSQAKFSLGSSTGSTTQVIGTSLTSGSYSYFVTAAAEYIIFNRQNTAEYYVNNVSVKEADRDNVPRIDYTGGGCPHILAEPQRTNLLTYSEDFTEYSISTTNLDTPTIVSVKNPSGVNSAGLLNINNGVSASKFIYLAISTSSSIHTQSIFVKYVDRQWLQLLSGGTGHYANFDIQNGVVGNTSACSSTIEDYGNGWYRCTTTLDSAATPTNLAIAVIDDNTAIRLTASTGTGSYYLFGSQVESGSYPTSYIPTSGSTVTRNQDRFTRDGIGSLINSTEGVLFVEMAALANDGTNKRISLSNGTNSYRVVISYSTSNNIQIFIVGAPAGTFAPSKSIDITLNSKIAVSWSSTEARFYVDGSPILVTLGNFSYTASTLSELKTEDGAGGSDFFGKVKQLQVYKTALTDEQLLQLTGESGTDFYESYAEMASALTYTIQ